MLLIGSTLVEGSTLSEQEAREVLAGRTVAGHSIAEVRELINYRAAVEHLSAELRVSPHLSLDLVTGFHRRLFQGLAERPGNFKTHRNFTFRSDGSRHDYLHPSAVPDAMQSWIDRFNAVAEGEPAAGAAALYYEFQHIHPFADGNGRIGRVLVAYWLHRRWRRSLSFYLRDKLAHLEAIERANGGDLSLLVAFFADRIGGVS